jgi:hypothetical protein
MSGIDYVVVHPAGGISHRYYGAHCHFAQPLGEHFLPLGTGATAGGQNTYLYKP